MCFGGDSTSTSTSNSSTHPDGAYQDALKKLLDKSTALQDQTYDPATGKTVAGFSSDQTAAQDKIRTGQGAAQPFINQAQGFATQAAGPISADAIQRYQNPFTSQVINATEDQFSQDNARAQSQVTGNAALSGALGGNRVGVTQALTQQAQERAQAPVIAGLRSQGYSQALGAAQQDAQRQQVAASQLGQLGNEAQSSHYQDVGALAASGAQQQGFTQSQDDANSQNAKDRQGFDYRNLQYGAGIDSALASSDGSTSTGSGTQTTPAPNQGTQLFGGALAGLSLFGGKADGGAVESKQGFAMGGSPYDSGSDVIPSFAPVAGPAAAQFPQMQPHQAAKQPSLADSMKLDKSAMQGLGRAYKNFDPTNPQNASSWDTTVVPEAATAELAPEMAAAELAPEVAAGADLSSLAMLALATGGAVKRGFADGGEPTSYGDDAVTSDDLFPPEAVRQSTLNARLTNEKTASEQAQREIAAKTRTEAYAKASSGLTQDAPPNPANAAQSADAPATPEEEQSELASAQQKQEAEIADKTSGLARPPQPKADRPTAATGYTVSPANEAQEASSGTAAVASSRARAPGSTLDFIKKLEGSNDNGWDVNQYSGPYGVKRGQNERLTLEQAESRLKTEIAPVTAELDNKINVPMSTGQKKALTSFFYNLGTGKGRLDHVAELMNSGRSDEVPAYMAQFTNAGGEHNPGLVNRRNQEIAEFGRANGAPQDDSSTSVASASENNGAEPTGLGAGFTAQAQPTSAEGKKPAETQNKGFLGLFPSLSENERMAMRSAGFGMLASKSPFFGVGVGEGGQAGMQTYQQLQQKDVDNSIKTQDAQLRAKEFVQKANQFKQEMELKRQTPKHVGNDPFGNPIYQAIGPAGSLQTSTTDPFGNVTAPQPGGLAPNTVPTAEKPSGLGAIGGDLHGEDYIKTIDPRMQSNVRGVVSGQTKLPPGKGPRADAIRAAALQADPGWEEGRYAARAAFETDLAKGPTGANIVAANTALRHLGQLDQDIDGLNNTSFPVENSASNFLNRNLGNTSFAAREKTFMTTANAAAKELEKAIIGGKVNQTEINEWRQMLNAADSPQALKAVVKAGIKLLDGRMAEIGEKKNNVMFTKNNSLELLSPEAQKIRAKLLGGGDGKSTESPAAVAQPAITVNSPDEAKSLPPNSRFMYKGKEYTK